jgi:regulatory protein
MAERYSINELISRLVPDDGPGREADPAAARKKAMDYLARREHAAGELTDKLVRAGFTPELAAATVEQLTIDGLQSDARFVEAFVHSRIAQGKGPVRIRAELGEHGIAAAVADEALAAAGEDWLALARAVRVRKFGRRLPREFIEKARQMRFLKYRGFEAGQVQAALADPDA